MYQGRPGLVISLPDYNLIEDKVDGYSYIFDFETGRAPGVHFQIGIECLDRDGSGFFSRVIEQGRTIGGSRPFGSAVDGVLGGFHQLLARSG